MESTLSQHKAAIPISSLLFSLPANTPSGQAGKGRALRLFSCILMVELSRGFRLLASFISNLTIREHLGTWYVSLQNTSDYASTLQRRLSRSERHVGTYSCAKEAVSPPCREGSPIQTAWRGNHQRGILVGAVVQRHERRA